RSSEPRAGGADVVADGHFLRAHESGVGAANVVGQPLIELRRQTPADVVGFEGCERLGHATAMQGRPADYTSRRRRRVASRWFRAARTDPRSARYHLHPDTTRTAPR